MDTRSGWYIDCVVIGETYRPRACYRKRHPATDLWEWVYDIPGGCSDWQFVGSGTPIYATEADAEMALHYRHPELVGQPAPGSVRPQPISVVS